MERAWSRSVAAGMVLAAAAMGLWLRLADPLAHPVVPAEDPYTHMALVRAHLGDGDLQPLNEGTGLYPPGLHAALAATWAASGLDLRDLALYGPAALGVLGVLGVGLLLWRATGPWAAAAGAAAFAILPEAVFRTSMLAPTALDLALLPFLALALLETVQGRLAWAAPAAALAAFLLAAHPWVFAVVAPAALLFLLLAVAAPAPGRALYAKGVALSIAVLGAAAAASLSGCAGWCGPGYAHVLSGTVGGLAAAAAPWVLAASLGAAALLWRWAAPAQAWLDQGRSLRPAALAALLAVAAIAIAAPSWGRWPRQVDPVHMFGLPVLAAAAAGLLVAAWRPSPGAHLGAALALATAPFALHDPFASPYWPQRTAAYLGLGLVLLAAVAADALVHALATRRPAARRIGVPAAWALPPLVLVSVLGGAWAATPAYNGGWYRLYEPCQSDALRAVASAADPGATIVTGSWQGKLAVAAEADDPRRVWFKESFFTHPRGRDGLQDRPLVAVVEPHMAEGADLSFLAGPGWSPLGAWCGSPGPAVAAYAFHPAPGASTA